VFGGCPLRRLDELAVSVCLRPILSGCRLLEMGMHFGWTTGSTVHIKYRRCVMESFMHDAAHKSTLGNPEVDAHADLHGQLRRAKVDPM